MMIKKYIVDPDTAVIKSTTGRNIIGPGLSTPAPEIYRNSDADETQYREAPRVFSKRRLYRELQQAEIWAQAKSYMETTGVWEDWEYATTLDEDDPLLVSAIAALRDTLGLADTTIEHILAESEVK